MEQVDLDLEIADFMSVMAPGHYNSMYHRGLSSAPRPETFNTNDWFNAKPPEANVSFVIGGVLWIISFCMFLYRVQKLKERTDGELKGNDLVRGWIACAIDNDSPMYTITSFSAISFLFLGGVQMDYENTLIFMICYYAVISFGDSFRVLLVYWSYSSLRQVMLLSEQEVGLKAKKEEDEREKDMKFETMEIQPNNIYEDIGREKTIVIMIFITQCILVSFVCIDVYRNETVRCMDGTPNCPIAGTAGSYAFYCMGIFQACVFLLGPKTSFGQSEQNPEFWLILLLATKKNGARLLWENPVKDPSQTKHHGTLRDSNGNIICDANKNPKLYHQRILNQSDFAIWFRFFMSYLVNGVCFHILVHALPIQVASQSTYTGVVFRAVGMMYLVDLDDSKGFRLIIAEKDEEPEEEPKKEEEKTADEGGDEGGKPSTGGGEDTPMDEVKEDVEEQRPPGEHTPVVLETDADQQALMAEQANEILQEAEYKLEMLRQHGLGGGGRQSRLTSARMSKGPATATTHLNLLSFGSKPAPNTRILDPKSLGTSESKKNLGQAALLQATTGTEGTGGGGGAGTGGGAEAGTGGGGGAGAGAGGTGGGAGTGAGSGGGGGTGAGTGGGGDDGAVTWA